MAGNSVHPHPQLSCILCTTIEAGKLEEVRKQIQAERDRCECEAKWPVYRVIKLYQKFLAESRRDSMAKSSVWKSAGVFKSNTRTLILETIAKLLAGGAHINYTTGLETPLMAALSTCDEELLWTLLDFKADVNLCDGLEDMNALGLAILLNEVSLVEMLLKHGGKVNSPCCGNLVPIQLAMNKNSAVSSLLIQYGADVHLLRTVSLDDKLFTSQSPLMVAILRKNVHLGRLLLEHGEDVNQTFPDSLEAPIHQAVRNLDLAMIDLLVQFGADLNKPNFERHTPVGLALLTEDPVSTEIAKRLIRAGASPNRRTRISFFQKTYTPLHIACFKGNFEFVRFLVEEVCGRMGYPDEEMEAPASESARVGNKDRYVVPDSSTTSFQEHYFKLLPHSDRCLGSTPGSAIVISSSQGAGGSSTRHGASSTTTPSSSQDFLQEGKDYHVRSEVSSISPSPLVTVAEGPSSLDELDSSSPLTEPFAATKAEGGGGKGDAGSVEGEANRPNTEPSSAGKDTGSWKSVARSPGAEARGDAQEAGVEHTGLCGRYHHTRQDHGAPTSRFEKTKPAPGARTLETPNPCSMLFSIEDAVIDEAAVKKRTAGAMARTEAKTAETESSGEGQSGGETPSMPAVQASCPGRGQANLTTSGDSSYAHGSAESVSEHHSKDATTPPSSSPSSEGGATAAPQESSPQSKQADASATAHAATSASNTSGPATPEEPVFQIEFGSPGYDYMAATGNRWQDMFYLREQLERGEGDGEESRSHSVVRFLNQEGSDGSTALFMAVYDGDVDLVNYLLDNGANPYFSSHHGNFFHAAVLSQSVPLIRRALELGCSINEHNVFGNSPLTLVSRLDLAEACEMLVTHGADMNSRDRYGETPLLASVYFGCEMNARTLIQHGATLDLVDDNHTSAIYWAIFNNRQRTLKLLLMAGAHFTPQIFRQYPRNIRVMHNRQLFRFIHHYIHQPRSLQDLATIRVRVHLGQVYRGQSILPSLDHLPIPNRLKEILRLRHFIQEIDLEADQPEGVV